MCVVFPKIIYQDTIAQKLFKCVLQKEYPISPYIIVLWTYIVHPQKAAMKGFLKAYAHVHRCHGSLDTCNPTKKSKTFEQFLGALYLSVYKQPSLIRKVLPLIYIIYNCFATTLTMYMQHILAYSGNKMFFECTFDNLM